MPNKAKCVRHVKLGNVFKKKKKNVPRTKLKARFEEKPIKSQYEQKMARQNKASSV